MTQDNIVKFAEAGAFEDPLTEVLRCGARKLLAQAVAAEVSDFLDRHSPAKAGSPRAEQPSCVRFTIARLICGRTEFQRRLH